MKESNKKIIMAFSSLALITILMLVTFSCESVVQQEEISLKGEKITDSYLQALSKTSYDVTNNATNAFEIYKVNTSSPKIEEVKQKIISVLKNLNGKTSNTAAKVEGGPELPTIGLESSVIIEENETDRQALLIPIDDGIDTRYQVIVSGYNESTNSIEKSIVVTAQGNYTEAEINANPQLIEQAEVHITFEAQNGQMLYSHTYTAQNYNYNIATVNVAAKSTPIPYYIACMANLGYLPGWSLFFAQTLGYGISLMASNPITALANFAVAIGIHAGCFYGALASWLWFDVLGFD